MKQFTFSLALLILIGLPVLAQESTQSTSTPQKLILAKAFEKLYESSKNGFSDLRLRETETSDAAVRIYYPSIEIENAEKTRIFYVSSYDFDVEYGNFNSEEAARSKVEELKKEFSNVYSVFKFTDYHPDILKSTICNFVQVSDKGIRVYRANFKIEKWGQTYKVSFHYPAYEKASTNYFFASPEKPCYIDYNFVDQQQSYDQFSSDLRKILEEAKTDFKNIKGGDILSPSYATLENEATIYVAGYPNCYIQSKTFSINYIIPYLKGGDFETTKTQLQSVISNVNKALGSDYAFNASADGMKTLYINRYRPEKNALTISITKNKDNTFDIRLYIEAESNK